MNNKIGMVVLALLAGGVTIALLVTKHQDAEKQRNDAATILDFSNQWTKASLNVEELRQVNLSLNNDLATNRAALADLSNNLTAISETVTNMQNSLVAAQAQITTQSARIADLQQQNKELNDRALELTAEEAGLTNRIAALNSQINDTLRQLADSKGNNAYLEKQLQQLIEAKAALEHKFNTLADVRAQVKKLRDDIYTARRLEWMKEGTDVQVKGAELLMQLRDRNMAPAAPDTNFGLHVEIGSDGSVRALPLNTNAAPAASLPAR